jgi:hypothetical protein
MLTADRPLRVLLAPSQLGLGLIARVRRACKGMGKVSKWTRMSVVIIIIDIIVM